MRRRQPRAIRLVAVGSLVASAVLAVLAPGAQTPKILGVLLAGLGLAAGELLDVTLPIARGRAWRFHGQEVALAASLMFLSGLGLWLAAILAGLVVLGVARQQGRSGRSMEYATASFVAGVGGAAMVSGGGRAVGMAAPYAAAVAVVVAAILRHLLAAGAVRLLSRRPLLPLVRRRLGALCLHASGNAAIGLLAAGLASAAPLGLAGLVVPVVLLVSSYEQRTRSTAQARLFAELARAQERAGARSVDASAGIVLTVAARMLGGADVEMLLTGTDGLVRYLGDEAGLRSRDRVEPRALDAPWVLRLMASGGVRLSRDDRRPECAARIGASDAPVAFLSARRPRGAPEFTRREAALVRALARQAEPWLSGAQGRDSGDAENEATDDYATALAAVREAARRVASHAEPARFDAERLVDELHGLERSVAALVGSAEERSSDPLVPRQRPGVEWTTTGRLARGSGS